MLKEPVDVLKFCKMPQIDIDNIYLGPSTKLTQCSCPPPPKYLDSEPFDEEYLNDSRYISEKDRLLYQKEFEEIVRNNEIMRKNEIKYEMYYNYTPQIRDDNYDNEEDSHNEITDDEDEDNYVEDEDFEIVRK
jgi:hypothetical protein